MGRGERWELGEMGEKAARTDLRDITEDSVDFPSVSSGFYVQPAGFCDSSTPREHVSVFEGALAHLHSCTPPHLRTATLTDIACIMYACLHAMIRHFDVCSSTEHRFPFERKSF